MSEWQPIETDPKDGNDILVYQQENERYLSSMETTYFSDVLGGFASQDGETLLDKYGILTHWMPLPPPPVNNTDES